MDFGTERWVDAGDVPLFVRSWGGDGGRDVLYWHGVGLSSQGGLKLADAAPQLAREHGLRVLALDAPGFGRSPARAPDRYHPHALADLVPPLLDGLGLTRVLFMGFSWGGDLGCHVAARHPGRLAGLVLLDAGYSDPPFDASLAYERYLERNHELARRTASPTVDPAVVAAIEHGIAQSPPSATRAALAASGLPVLVVAAGDAPEDELAAFAAEVPSAEIVRTPGAGHDVLGVGGEATVRIVGEWLAGS